MADLTTTITVSAADFPLNMLTPGTEVIDGGTGYKWIIKGPPVYEGTHISIQLQRKTNKLTKRREWQEKTV